MPDEIWWHKWKSFDLRGAEPGAGLFLWLSILNYFFTPYTSRKEGAAMPFSVVYASRQRSTWVPCQLQLFLTCALQQCIQTQFISSKEWGPHCFPRQFVSIFTHPTYSNHCFFHIDLVWFIFESLASAMPLTCAFYR